MTNLFLRHPSLKRSPVGQPAARQPASRTWTALLMLGALVGLTWFVSRRQWFEAGDEVGYWIGVAGGSMMLLLLLYPLRKRVRALKDIGKPKTWLWVHMLLGVGGPLLILLHCGFRAGSLNAAAALYSMCIVAGSGVLGRFLYVRVNRGLVVERQALAALRLQQGFDGDKRSLLWFAPPVQDALNAFEADALARSSGAGRHWLRLLMVLPVRSWRLRWQAQREAVALLRVQARVERWDAQTLRRRQRVARGAIVSHLGAVMRVALFAAWERLFALWHVAHIPFVFLLVIAGVVHVVAVHAY